MSNRVTKSQVIAQFIRLANALGKAVYLSSDVKAYMKQDYSTHPNLSTNQYSAFGAWSLDHSSVYGGYVITEWMNSSGGENNPLGDSRRSGAEFCDCVRFALNALHIAKGK